VRPHSVKQVVQVRRRYGLLAHRFVDGVDQLSGLFLFCPRGLKLSEGRLDVLRPEATDLLTAYTAKRSAFFSSVLVTNNSPVLGASSCLGRPA
jgi:hypothetical protein